jgi:hypothetical protein
MQVKIKVATAMGSREITTHLTRRKAFVEFFILIDTCFFCIQLMSLFELFIVLLPQTFRVEE